MQVTGATRPTPPRVGLRFSREDGAIEVSPAAFKDSYVNTLCSRTGVPVAQLENLSLAVCHALAVQLVGPVQAVVLGGEAIKALATSKDLDDLDAGMRQRLQARPLTGNIHVAPQDTVGFGASTSRTVILPEGFEPLVGHATGDFIVGHELGHVKQLDVVAGYGRAYLCSKLGEATQAEVAPLLGQLNREAELHADREGLNYALDRGHQPAKLLAGVEQFLGLCDADDSDSHPGRQTRLDNVVRVLAGRTPTE